MSEIKPRVLIVSHRFVKPHVSWASAYEFEDIVCEIDDVDVLALEHSSPRLLPGENRVLARLKNRLGLDVQRQPVLKKTTITKPYHLLFIRVMTPSDLRVLQSIDGWHEHCRIKVCWIEELWLDMLKHTKVLEPLRQFDHVFVGHVPTPGPLADVIDKPCSFLSPAVDALRFCPYPNPPDRSIDFYALGRRSPDTHRSLLELAESRKGFMYFYDSARWTTFVDGHVAHRLLTANLIQRTRYFLADRAKANAPGQTKGSQVFGPRFFEGAGGGAVMIGDPPQCDTFNAYFDWPDAVVPLPYGSTHVGDLIGELDADPARLTRARLANVTNVLRRHDWAHRWRAVLDTLDLAPREDLAQRFSVLERRAQEVERAPELGAAVL